MPDHLAGRVAIVTGGTGAIGRACARHLATMGASVVVHSRSSRGDGEAAATELGGIYAQADLTLPDAGEKLVAAAIDKWQRLDIVVNCAGTTEYIEHADLDAATNEVWSRILDTNLLAPWSLIRAAAPHLAANNVPGCVVNVSSAAGIRPLGSSIPYAVSKAALNHLTVLLAKALGPQVRVNAVAPGIIDSPWTAGFADHRAHARESIPMRGLGTVDDVAEAVVYLASARYVTGEILVVDGGLQVTS